jgi:AcrR family transcriptional regulator
MNTKNNKTRRASLAQIRTAFVELLDTTPLHRITVSDICKKAHVNRSTFYANFADVYDLADWLRKAMEIEFSGVFDGFDGTHCEKGALRLFKHIKENQSFYINYFKLSYDEDQLLSNYDHNRASLDFGEKHIPYHIEFFRNGLNAIIKRWLKNGCLESPEEMAEILIQEYRGR